MNIPWKIKSSAYRVVDILNAPKLLDYFTRFLTRRLRKDSFGVAPNWDMHKNCLLSYEKRGCIFEFGAGKHLAQNLYLSDVVDKQIVVDLYHILDLSLVESVRGHLSKLVELRSEKSITRSVDLLEYGIQYRAPFDASCTDLATRSIDACVSTDTLEHLPKDAIYAIFSELYRIIKDDGIVTAVVDYSDHYSHTDSKIGSLNFLRFSEEEWKKYNHRCHYQNRLRHYELVEIFEKCGFVAVEENLTYSEDAIPMEANEFYGAQSSTWRATSAHIVLIKRDPG